MKNIPYTFLLIGLLFGCSLGDNISPKTVSTRNTFGLKYKDITNLKAEGIKINLELSEIEDGRCLGKNIVCIWGGDIFVTLLLDNTQVIKLRLNGLTLDKLTSLPAPTPMEASYRKEVRVKLNEEPYIIHLEKVDVKNLNEEQASLTPKENYTVWLRIFKSPN